MHILEAKCGTRKTLELGNLANPPLLARAAASRPVCHTNHGGQGCHFSLTLSPAQCCPAKRPRAGLCPAPTGSPSHILSLSTSEAAAAIASGLWQGKWAWSQVCGPERPVEDAGREHQTSGLQQCSQVPHVSAPGLDMEVEPISDQTPGLA